MTSESIHEPLRAVVCYSHGQSSCSTGGDDQIICGALRDAGMQARSVDLSNVHEETDGTLVEHDPTTDDLRPWLDPHVVLMYHGAIAPAHALDRLEVMAARGSAIVNGPQAWPVFTDKLVFAQYMDERGVRVIPSEPVADATRLRAAVAAVDGAAVVKKPISTEGDDIYVVHDAASLDAVISVLPELGDVIVQPVIDSRIGEDIEPAIARVLVDGERGRRHEFRINTARFADGSISVDACYMRIAPDERQIVNNVAQGARPIRVPFDGLHPLDRATLIAAAEQAPPTGDIIGWDVIGQPGERRIIEGNSGSGLPTGAEGIPPSAVVGSYARVLREAGAASVLRQSASTRGPKSVSASAPVRTT